MKEPTEEEIKRLWEWCGFRHIPAQYCKLCKRWEGEYWLKEDISRRIHRPELLVLDLNNLFKWAVPKLDQANYYEALRSIFVKNEAPALALFWAINKIIEGE